MSLIDRLVAWNARQARSWSIPLIVFKGLVGLLLAGIVLALFVPALSTRGVRLAEWMVWTVIVLSIAVCIGPDLYRRFAGRLTRR